MATRKRKEEGVSEQDTPVMKEPGSSASYIPVEGNKDLVRDPSTGAILNINKKAYFRAIQERMRRKQEDDEYNSLRTEVAELKTMLAELLGKLNGSN